MKVQEIDNAHVNNRLHTRTSCAENATQFLFRRLSGNDRVRLPRFQCRRRRGNNRRHYSQSRKRDHDWKSRTSKENVL